MNQKAPIHIRILASNVLLISIASFAMRTITAHAADWPEFRGVNRDGISTETKAPLEWSATRNVKWKAPLPQAGNSSPIVSGDRVFVTCAEDEQGTRRSLYCFNRSDGKQLWVQTATLQAKEPVHQRNGYCASTPAADGKRIVVWHGSAGVYCYDHDGKKLWSRDLGTFHQIWGYGSSPIIHGDMVLINCGPGANSFAIALNAADGQTIWKTDEPGGADDKNGEGQWVGSWATPVIAKVDGVEQAIVPQSRRVNGYDLKTGKILWTCTGTGNLDYCDIMIGDGIAVAASGYNGPAIGFKLGGAADITATNRLWRVEKNPQRIGTGVVIANHLFMVSEPGLSCIDIATGKELWKERLAGQTFWGSITAVGDRLYATSQKGTTYVFAADAAKFHLLSTNEIDEGSNSTPAVVDGEIFLRTFKNLYCIASP